MRGLLLVSALVLALACASFAALNSGEREALLDAAIEEVKLEGQARKTSTKTERSPTGLLKAFKKAPASAIAQGAARLMFEQTVKRAERNIMEKERKTSSQTDAQARAEALARELMHTPGTLLNEEEIAKIYQASQCAETLPMAGDCSLPVFQKHRSSDGSCNNLGNPLLGAAQTTLRRLLPPRYEDGVSQLRGFLQSTGSDLYTHGPFSPPNPSARVVSLGVVRDRPVESTTFTHILMQWGQFMDHDMTLVPEFGEAACEGCQQEEGMCAQIPVPFDDRDIEVTRVDEGSRGCHPFRRSLPACDPVVPTTMFPREHQNILTAYIDGSQVYSSNKVILDNFLLDPNDAAMLAVSPGIGNGKPNLPLTNNANLAVGCPANTDCFIAGDIRVNEQTGLIAMHTIWMREHNRVAALIRQFNSQFSPSKVFLTAREIISAQIQKISYKDYLPILIGDELDNLLGPYLPQGYNDEVDPSIPNSFAAAAYRFGHSQIQPFFDRLDQSYDPIPEGPLSLIDAFFNVPAFFDGGGTDPILRGLVSKPARSVDEFLVSLLTNNLFASDSSSVGLDLATLNIQRGRDHGLPPYLVWKRWAERVCGVSSEFKNELTKIHLLETYGSFDTIDLWVGGLAEESLPGGVVGATFACIFAKTFSNLRHGDRFYYENNDPATGLFTPEQTAEIEKASLSRVICDNGDDIQSIQPDAFRVMNRVPCTDIPSMDLQVFSAPELPSTCYMGLANVNSYDHVTSISRLWPDTVFHVERHIGPTCIPFACPESGDDGRPVRVLVINPGCSVQPNQNLGVRSGRFFFGRLDESDIVPENGIYTSEDSCEQGTEVALTFNCWKTAAQDNSQTLTHSTNTQQDQTPDISMDVEMNDNVVPADYWEMFLENEADTSPQMEEEEEEEEDGEKLVALLQDVLAELKRDKTEETKAYSDEQLVSELAKALNAMH